jgi:hypothetical protein
MRPSRDGTDQHQYQNDQQNGSQSHGLLLGEWIRLSVGISALVCSKLISLRRVDSDCRLWSFNRPNVSAHRRTVCAATNGAVEENLKKSRVCPGQPTTVTMHSFKCHCKIAVRAGFGTGAHRRAGALGLQFAHEICFDWLASPRGARLRGLYGINECTTRT